MSIHTGASALAQKLHDEFPDAPTLALARRLYRENVALFKDVETARRTMRYIRGTCGPGHRKTRGLKEPLRMGYAGMAPSLPPSQAKPWVGVELEYPCRVLSLSDAHVPYHDEQAIKAAVAHGKKFKPDVLLLNGDWADCFSISRWEKNPSQRNFVAEVDKVELSLEWLQSEFPKARKIFKYGNHEERYNHFIWQKAPEIWGIQNCQLHEILHLDEYGFEYVDEGRPIIAGHLPIFHGHELPKGMSSPVNAARGAYLRMGASVLIGHHHRSSTHSNPNWKKDEIVCWSQGCLCDRSPDYAKINSWDLGFAVVEVAADREFDVWNFKIGKDYKVRAS
jgi:predicted phosphodiesterase